VKITKRFLNRNQAGAVEFANRGLDVLGCFSSAVFISLNNFVQPVYWREWILLVLLHTFATLLSFQQSEAYRSWRGRPFSDQFSRLILAWCIGAITATVVWLALGLHHVLSIQGFILWLLANGSLIIFQRAILYSVVRTLRKKGGNQKIVVIYGAGSLGQAIAAQVRKSPESGFQIAAFIDDNHELFASIKCGVPVMGSLARLERLLEEVNADEIWIALPLSATQKVASVLKTANSKRRSVRMFPDLNGLTLLNHSVSELLGFPIIELTVDRMHGLNRVVKEIEDKLLGLLLLLLATPFLIAIALAIRLSSGAPVLFRQRRRGWDGKIFTIYKFRTMRLHQELSGQLTQAKRLDGRLTPLGRWLRRSSLDELPQLVNVLQGRMSLVGPRPHAIEHDQVYEQHIEGYQHRSRVKPGITGWAQINDLRGEVLSIEEMNRRVKHDLYYIEHWTLWFDLRILLATVFKIFFSKKAW